MRGGPRAPAEPACPSSARGSATRSAAARPSGQGLVAAAKREGSGRSRSQAARRRSSTASSRETQKRRLAGGLGELYEAVFELAQERGGFEAVFGALLDAGEEQVGLGAGEGNVEEAPLLEEVAPVELGPRGRAAIGEQAGVHEPDAARPYGEPLVHEPAHEHGLELEALGGVDGEETTAPSPAGPRAPRCRNPRAASCRP